MKVYILGVVGNVDVGDFRESEDYPIEVIGVFDSLQSAKSKAFAIRDKHFFKKTTKFYKKGGRLLLSDSGSYGDCLTIIEKDVQSHPSKPPISKPKVLYPGYNYVEDTVPTDSVKESKLKRTNNK